MLGTGQASAVDFMVPTPAAYCTNSVLHARAGAKELPNSFGMNLWGWAFGKDGTRREMAPADSSRLEVGHRYVLAVRWLEPRCSEGDPTEPGTWAVIGSGGALPYDDNRLGWGEVEGTAKAVAASDSVPGSGDTSVLSSLDARGEVNVASLEAVLAQAPAASRQAQPGVRQGC